MAERAFGSMLRALRTDARMTVEELAEASGVSVRAIGDLERGRVRFPQRRTAQALADGLALRGADRDAFLAAPAARSRTGSLAQLPPDLPVFAGRRAELDDALASLPGLPGAAGRLGGVVLAIGGMAGVGKTTLALHWAHRVARHYPDGQLWVDLRGFDRNDDVSGPAEALAGLLRTLGVPAARIPAGTDARSALFRGELAGRRLLLVLDNARDSDQARPLLPASAGCLTIVTSRNRLTGLIAAAGAHALTLDVWSEEEARQAFALRCGPGRVAREPEAADEITALCGHLPLAVAVVAARAVTRPELPLRDLAAELREAHGTLDAFGTRDTAADARAVFSWSHRLLRPAAARLFRLLGLYPGSEIGLAAAASLAALPPRRTRPLLAELAEAHLVTERGRDRWRLHDLLRAYASERAEEDETPGERRAAYHRLLDHFLLSASRARPLLYTGPAGEPAIDALPGAVPAELTTTQQAVEWFKDERAALLQARARAAGDGFHAHAWQIAWMTSHWAQLHGTYEEKVAALVAALDSARRAAAGASRVALIQRGLARAYAQRGRWDEAHDLLRPLLTDPELAGPLERGLTYRSLGWVLGRQHRHREALRHARLALDCFRAAGDRPAEARERNAVAWYLALAGEHEAALAACDEALPLIRELDERSTEAAALDTKGYVLQHLGRHREAVEAHRGSLELNEELGDLHSVAEVLTHLGDAHRALGEADAARAAWRRALDVMTGLGYPDDETAAVRTRLADTP